MAASLTSTGVTYGDSTSQATAFVGGRGQIFTSSGSFTIPTGVTALKIIAIGGGGAGGQLNAPDWPGGGGGAGGTAVKFATGLTPGTSLTITIGAAGTTTAGGATSVSGTGLTTITCNGGNRGGQGGGSSVQAGGAATGGDINITGGSGACGLAQSATNQPGCGGGSSGQAGMTAEYNGHGGAGFMGLGAGGGAPFAGPVVGSAAANATGYGNGGLGGTTRTAASRNGTQGIVIIEW